MTPTRAWFAACLLFPSLSCSSAYYGTLEKLGIHKRDLLVDRVEDARDAQDEAKEQFQSALQAFQSLTGFEGGDLEKKYERLDDEYQESDARANDVRERIESIETVADDLFDEWKDEIGSMEDKKLKDRSRALLDETRDHYEELDAAMKRAAKKMDPVLAALHDHVLFLKHNLNARAIASLEDDLDDVQLDVGALVKEMEASIAEANEFLARMEEGT